jgi:hypothetical protein
MKAIYELIEKLKNLGLHKYDIQKCVETYRDCGEQEALEQANDILLREKIQTDSVNKIMDAII